MIRFRQIKFLSIVLFTGLLMACATSPTGRSQLLLFSSQQMGQLGVQAFSEMKQDLNVSSQQVKNQYVQCVADNITRQVPKNVFPGDWEVVVFDDPQVNAFALPGGKIGVFTGLLEVANNQHQLAAVIGHEVGHVLAEHGNERMSHDTVIGITSEVVNQALAYHQVSANRQIMSALGAAAQYGVVLPYSRSHESEADVIGLDLMAQAGFDPRESVSLWQNMARAGGERPPEFFSTHPAPQSRIQKLQSRMESAMQQYENTPQRPDCQ